MTDIARTGQTGGGQTGGDQARRDRLLKLATAISVSVASTLAVLKLGAWLVTGSAAILSSLLDSMVDVAASGILMISVRHALRPPDRSHRFGHGKAEPLGAIAQAAFVGGSALLLIFESAGRFITPEPVAEVPLGIAVMLVSLVATISLVLFQRSVARRTDSTAIAADRLNYVGDTATSIVVLAVLVIGQRPGWQWLDPAAAIGVALWLLASAAGIARRAVDHLMDRELPQEDRSRIAAIVRADPEVAGLHDMRTRSAGGTRFIELHVEMDGGLTLWQAHTVCDRLEAALSAAFPDSEVILHQEPAGLDDDRLDHRIYKRRT
ncbi:cation diffusion facilitator family transporter [Inquilinus limosus]|uniref:cation diffusion facilitator family transporter n=1 Tax=Inquilinus limosus TaxID=171674 RepID=UPI001E511487|nr:cation diffusion facilitator family transporter [Inquilinus limosus]